MRDDGTANAGAIHDGVVERTARFGDFDQIEIRSRSSRTGVVVDIVSVRLSAAQELVATFQLDMASPGRCVSSAHPSLVWSMVRGVPRYRYGNDFAGAIISRAHHAMFKRRFTGLSEADRRRWRPASREMKQEASKIMRAVFSWVRELAIEAVDRCDPTARAVALRFPWHLRLPVYARIVADGSRRLAQLASSCPGALAFALALVDGWRGVRIEGLAAAGERLLSDVQAGRRLGEALDAALEVWDAHVPTIAALAECDLRTQDAEVWLQFCDLPTASRRAALLNQRLLIRRAGPAVASSFLLTPPLASLVPEDIPVATRANARWYWLMKAVVAPILVHRPWSEAAGQDFSSFVSCHMAGLFSRLRRKNEIRRQLAQVADYVGATHRRPSRTTDLEGLLSESARWHEQVARVREVAATPDLLPVVETGPNAVLPPPPFEAVQREDFSVRPLRTAMEVLEEGQRMQHCVVSRLDSAVAGRICLASVEIAGRRLTAELIRSHRGLRLGELAGPQNRDPTPQEMERVLEWLHELRAATSRFASGVAQ